MFEIRNYGNTRKLWVDGMNIEMPRNGAIRTDDKGIAEGLSAYPYIDSVEIKERPDILGMKKNELMRLVSRNKIPFTFSDTKETLLKKLQDFFKKQVR